jgi:uncharacterized protein (DUF1501 family)
MNRRAFLMRSGAAALAGMGAPWAMDLAGIAHAAQAQASEADDYKALVCVFLQGGNDQANTLIPIDSAGFGLYQRLRGQLALPLSDLQATRVTPDNAASLPTGLQLALAPKLSPLLDLFNTDKKLALLLNIGPLVKPVTVEEFKSALLGKQDGSVLPPKLFSHNDQQSVWQSYGAEGSTVGWGGLIGDAGLASNKGAADNSPLTCVNLAGNVVYVAGMQAGQFMVNPYEPDALMAIDTANMFGSQQCVDAFASVTRTQAPSVHRLAKEHSKIMRRAVASNTVLLEKLPLADAKVPMRFARDGLLTAVGESDTPELKGNLLAAQLNTAARMIAIHKELGLKRQVFFVSLGGFDTHDNLVLQHPLLLAKLANALKQFDSDLQALGMRDQVVTFTASDFGRTVTSNGDGSDHGWGSHHIVMGGQIKGGRVYGQWPDISGFDSGTHNVGQGRLLPTMAVDHLAARLAQWMGVTDANALKQIAPHLGNFPGASPLADLL